MQGRVSGRTPSFRFRSAPKKRSDAININRTVIALYPYCIGGGTAVIPHEKASFGRSCVTGAGKGAFSRKSGFSVRRGGGFAAEVSRAVPFSIFRCRLFVCPVFCFCRMVFFPAGRCFGRKDEFCVLRRMGEALCLSAGGWQGSVHGRLPWQAGGAR